MGTITLSEKQQRRAAILGRLTEGRMSVQQASGLLGVSERQVRRQRARYVCEGLGSLVHGNAGREPANKTPAALRGRLAELAGEKGTYHDFNTCHLQEQLAENEGLQIGRSTVDRLLVADGVRKRARSRPRRTFRQRERCARSGEMLLTDGSSHDWLEGRDSEHPRMCLIGSVDDANGHLVHLRFWPTECQAGYIQMAREITLEHGIPMSFYHDRHTILCSPKEPTLEDELAGREPMSRFQSILALLGTEPIKAMTPQAKGRIERLWRTLQDRLVKELRLAQASTLQAANAFLPAFIERYNARFGVEAREPEPAWVAAEDLDVPFYFAAKEERTVRADHTLAWRGQTLQIERKRAQPSLAGTRVMVHTTPEGEVFLYAAKQRLAYRQTHKPTGRPARTTTPTDTPTDTPTHTPSPEKRQQARRRQMAYLHTGATA